MNSAVKVIKRGQNKISTGALASQDEQTGAQSTREIAKTVKGWISELHQRRRDEQVHTSALRKMRVTLPLIALCFLGLGMESQGQQLRDAFHKVEQAVVVVRTEQQGLAPFPQQGMVSLNGIGSGVLISNDKVLTAAHLVQAADRTMVEFSRGELIPARYWVVVFCRYCRAATRAQPGKRGTRDTGEFRQAGCGRSDICGRGSLRSQSYVNSRARKRTSLAKREK